MKEQIVVTLLAEGAVVRASSVPDHSQVSQSYHTAVPPSCSKSRYYLLQVQTAIKSHKVVIGPDCLFWSRLSILTKP